MGFEQKKLLLEYGEIIREWYPDVKRVAEDCPAQRLALFQALSAMTPDALAREQLMVAALAFNACTFSPKQDLCGFRFAVDEIYLSPVFRRLQGRHAVMDNIFSLMREVEYTATTGVPLLFSMFDTADSLLGPTVDDGDAGDDFGGNGWNDEFEMAQDCPETGDGLGLDDVEDEG